LEPQAAGEVAKLSEPEILVAQVGTVPDAWQRPTVTKAARHAISSAHWRTWERLARTRLNTGMQVRLDILYPIVLTTQL